MGIGLSWPWMKDSPAARILVVDDEKTVRRLLERFLTKEGFQVLTAGEGKDALELVKCQKPHVILLDIRMPGMDGMEVLKAIRQIDPSVPIVMLTGVTDLDHIKLAVGLGADDYLLKPFDLSYVLSYLGHYLQERVERTTP
jgi:DNA-binding response OmpR family regulator